MKKNLCMVNVLISFILFSVMLGYVCFRYGAGRTSYIGQVVGLCVYLFAILFVAAVLAHSFYHPRKGLLFGAIFSLAYDVLALLALFFLWVTGQYQGMAEGFLPWFIMLGTALVSGLYFWAAFAGEKEGERP